MSLFTAIVLSARPVMLAIPGVQVLGCTQVLRSPAELHAARLDALAKVQTPFCFFLDDDDELTDDYLSVLDECMGKMQAQGAAMAYTDEILREDSTKGMRDHRRVAYSYDSDLHAKKPMLVHHLVVMDSGKAKAAAKVLPRGNFWTEHMLYWKLGLQGAVYVIRVGYIWSRNPKGFSRTPQILAAQSFSMRWINQQRAAA